MRDALDVLFVFARENDHVMLGLVGAIEAEILHERRAGEFALAKDRWVVATETLLLEERAHGMAEVGVDYDVVTVDLFATGQFDAAGAAAIQQHATHRTGRVDFGAFRASDLGEGVTDSAKPAHDVVHPMRVPVYGIMVKRPGQSHGDIPRYFDWNVNARRSSSERK
jgi:hypothetical protein